MVLRGFFVWAKSDSVMSAVADHQGLSLRGKNRTQNKCPNEEINKKTKTNVHIGTLERISHLIFDQFNPFYHSSFSRNAHRALYSHFLNNRAGNPYVFSRKALTYTIFIFDKNIFRELFKGIK